MNILVTGGAGYIGSHTVIELLEAGHEVVVIDNLSNSSREALRRVEVIANKKLEFYEADVRDAKALDTILSLHSIDAVIHFAGLKSVGDSVAKPLHYYGNNIESTIRLLEKMERFKVKNLVFSSSATVYGVPKKLPIAETAPRSATNPYGQTKLMIEQILEDLTGSKERWSITSLRYFNPIGAHESGTIGEDPNGMPNNLVPYVSQVAVGRLDKLRVYGDDYETVDGTGVRDYIHVVDLARAHVSAIENINHPDKYKVYNIGTGKGTSVLEVVSAFKKVSDKLIPYEVVRRRPGDIASCYADPTLARRELNWSAKLTIEDACRDSWRWQSQNPEGYV